MGGYGSTRWGWHKKALTVEACRELSIFRLVQAGVISPGVLRSGGWGWFDNATGEKRASISYKADIEEDRGVLELGYNITARPDLGRLEFPIALVTTSPNYGGRRWWFICPLTVGKRDCRRRVGKLYLPPGGHYFGCRHCYGLTYKSSQESDKRVNELVRLFRQDPGAALARVNAHSGAGDLLLLLKAYDKIGLLDGRW